jgi:hypothetical protein
MPQPPKPDRSATLLEGSANLAPKSGAPSPAADRSGTLIETDDEVREAIAGLKSHASANVQAPAPARPTSLFRPTFRPPVALLTVYDDGRSDGELIRIRTPKFVIGRSDGDLRIPIDARLSGKHIEISLQTVGGVHRWVVTDLQSTHGTFVRVSRTVLADGAEFLVGNGRYRFDFPEPSAAATGDYVPDDPSSGETRGWDAGPNPFQPPALTELVGGQIGNRIVLMKPEYWIGSDHTCAISRSDDPFCDPRHIRLFRGQRGNWHAEHNHTQNGLWLRMTQIVAESMVHFQAGEQRFRLKVQ